MARKVSLKLLRTTKANLVAQAALNNLVAGEPYFITDENRVAVGTSTSTYETYAKESELGGGGSQAFTYNPDSTLNTITYADGTLKTFAYSGGKPEYLDTVKGGVTNRKTFNYNPGGTVASVVKEVI
jgi:hypothetical protein